MRRAALSMLAIAAASGVAATAAQAAFPGTNGRIAFASNRDGDGEIFVMNSDGTQPLQLTANSVDDASPVWSPDGSRVAYVHRTSGAGGSYDIYVMNANGTSQTRLTTSAFSDLEPAWSADGTEVVFDSDRTGNRDVFKLNVAAQTADPDTAETQLTTDTGDDTAPAWSPSGTAIAFTSSRPSNTPHLFTMNTDGNSQVRVTTQTGGEARPAWSPDGLSLAYQSLGDVYTLAVADPDNTQTQLTTNAANDNAPRWSPDGSRIVFETDRHATGPPAPPNVEIYSLLVADPATTQTRLTNDLSRDSAPDWGTQPDAAGGTTASITFQVEDVRGTPQWSEVQVPGQPEFAGTTTDGFGSITRTLTVGDHIRFTRSSNPPPSRPPPEDPYVEYTVPSSPPANVTITLPNTTGPSYLPELSDAERWVLGNVNADRVAHGVPALHVSQTLNRTADAEARDDHNQRAATGSYTFPAPYFTVTRIDWGWPTGDSDLTVVDAPSGDPAAVLAHWNGTEGSEESLALAHALRSGAYNAIGIGDGGGVWILHLDACPMADPAASRCELTADTGDPNIVLPPYVPGPGDPGGPGGPAGPGGPGGPSGPGGPGGGGGAGGAGASKPQTTITKAKFKKGRHTARFTFKGSGGTGALTFECKLDKRAFKPCKSPKTYKKLKAGKHRFQARAKDASGNFDASPAVRKFKIPKSRRARAK